jgi:hypothetical protein
MPLSSGDLAYERTEVAGLALADTCTVEISVNNPDFAGGRTKTGVLTSYAGVPCRLVADGPGLVRVDAAGEAQLGQFIILMELNNAVPEGVLVGNYTDRCEIRLNTISGDGTNRLFRLVSYSRVSEMDLRVIFVREVYL